MTKALSSLSPATIFSSFLVALGLFLLAGCAVHKVGLPELPGPADEVHLSVDRVDSERGTYELTIRGHYFMSKWEPESARLPAAGEVK